MSGCSEDGLIAIKTRRRIMKQVFKLAPLAVAVAALSLSGVAIAGSDGPRLMMAHGNITEMVLT